MSTPATAAPESADTRLTPPADASPAASGASLMRRRLTSLVSPGTRRALRSMQGLVSMDELRSAHPLSVKLRAWSRGFYVEHALMYGLDRIESGEYVSDVMRLTRCRDINPIPQLFSQKLLLRRVVADRGFRQPATVALVAPRDVIIDPIGADARHATLPDLAAELLARGGPYIVKPQDGMYGRGISRLEVRNGTLVLRRGESSRPLRVPQDLPPNTLIEGCAEQHAFWDGLFPGSVNTMRILTMWVPGDAAPFVGKAILRMGTRETIPTDNWDGGGVMATVDLATGRLGAGRVNPFRSAREDRPYTHHPDSGAAIEGAMLPHWERIVDTTLALARSLPMAYYVGWDVAVAPDGEPLFIEGNHNSGVRILQLDRGLLADPRVRRFYDACGVL